MRRAVERKKMPKEYVEQRDGNYYVAETRVSRDEIVATYTERRKE